MVDMNAVSITATVLENGVPRRRFPAMSMMVPLVPTAVMTVPSLAQVTLMSMVDPLADAGV